MFTNTFINNEKQHIIRDTVDPYDPAQTHQFHCSCGEEFLNHSMTKNPPKDAPSKSAAHRAKMLARAVGVQFEKVQNVGELAVAPIGAVICDAHGTLMQLVEMLQETVWETQHADALRVQEVALPAEVIWAPVQENQ